MTLLYIFAVRILKLCCTGGCVCFATLMMDIKGLWPGTTQCLNVNIYVFMSQIRSPGIPSARLSASYSLPSPTLCVYILDSYQLTDSFSETVCMALYSSCLKFAQ